VTPSADCFRVAGPSAKASSDEKLDLNGCKELEHDNIFPSEAARFFLTQYTKMVIIQHMLDRLFLFFQK
jgi:hypothetical protein